MAACSGPGYAGHMASLARSIDRRELGVPLIGIVDADRRVRHSLTDLLRLGGVRVAGAVGSSREALEMVELHGPDVLVIDPRLPTVEAGAALLSRIRTTWPGIHVVLIGWRDGLEGEAGIEPAIYVSKNAAPVEFLRAILDALRTAPPTS